MGLVGCIDGWICLWALSSTSEAREGCAGFKDASDVVWLLLLATSVFEDNARVSRLAWGAMLVVAVVGRIVDGV